MVPGGGCLRPGGAPTTASQLKEVDGHRSSSTRHEERQRAELVQKKRGNVFASLLCFVTDPP